MVCIVALTDNKDYYNIFLSARLTEPNYNQLYPIQSHPNLINLK
jgi:hypothetical protein